MRIPSYDDLTPSIPDVSPGEVFASVARLLPIERPAAPPDKRGAPPASTGLFACLRSARMAGAIVEIAREFSPRIERHGADSVVVDISGLERLLGSPESIGAELARMAARDRSDIRIAVARTQIAAQLVTLGDATLTVVTGDEAAALFPLPLQALQQHLAGIQGGTVLRGRHHRPDVPQADDATERTFDILQRWGVKTLGDFAALPSADLSSRIGQEGIRLQSLARGIDPRPLVPDPDVPRFVQRMELEWPIDSLEPLSFVFARLLEPLSSALERADRAAAAIRLHLRLVDRTTHERMLQLPAAMRDPRVLRTLLLLDLEAHPPSEGIDIVTIEVDPAPGRVIQYSLLERALPSAETLATLTARLHALVGESRCGSPELVDSHRPDAFVMRRFDLGGSGLGGSGLGARGPQALPRTPEYRAPECRAPESRAPESRLPALRRFRPPVAVRVSVARGRPIHVAIDRRGMPGGAVVQAAGPWRSSGGWWNCDHPPWHRDEWDVEFSDGVVCHLFYDRDMDGWFMDGIVD